MPSPLLSALLALIEAKQEHASATDEARWMTPRLEQAERNLAQAGDALESELRKMMRDECPGVPYVGRLRPEIFLDDDEPLKV